MLSSMQYPHWMMVGGAVLLVIGFLGLAFRQNGEGGTVDERIPRDAAEGDGE